MASETRTINGKQYEVIVEPISLTSPGGPSLLVRLADGPPQTVIKQCVDCLESEDALWREGWEIAEAHALR